MYIIKKEWIKCVYMKSISCKTVTLNVKVFKFWLPSSELFMEKHA